MTKLAQARAVAEKLLASYSNPSVELLMEAYLRGRSDERRLCKDIASKVRQALGWKD